MRLAGIDLDDDGVAELVTLLRGEYYNQAADTLEVALRMDQADVALTIRERTYILDVLDDPPDELKELRRMLLDEHVWRVRHGLAPACVP